jgi:TolB-like protein/Tfp pilus assembly protein PilF
MKQCPQCKLVYADENLNYCLEDGAVLVNRAAESEPATAIIPSPHVTYDDPTRSFRTDDIPAVSIPVIPQTEGSSKTRFYLLIAAAVLVLAAGFFGYRYYNSVSSGQIESIAVMPFVNASGNQDLEYLSDGVTESMINSLSQLSKLSVKARSSVFRYKGKDIEPQQVAADLKVQAVLNGRVTQRGDNLTISLDLVDGATGNQIWGEQYSRKTGDLAALQSEIARDISQKLRDRLTGAEASKVVRNQTQNTEAYQLYLQGRYNWNKRTDESAEKAIQYFQQAIEKDPNYAMAYVGLAESYILSNGPDEVRLPKAKAAALKAIEIDPTLGEPHTALANCLDNNERNSTEREKEFKKAIELSPNYATAYHWWAEALVSWGRFDEGLAEYKKALELDPFSLAIGTDYAIALYYARRNDQSIDQLKKLIEIDPNYVRIYTYLARVYQSTGKFEEALNAHEKRLTLEGADPQEVAKGKQAILNAYRTSGARGYWSKVLELTLQESGKGQDVKDPVGLAKIYAQLGQRDEAFKWLDKAIQTRVTDEVFMMEVSPEWDGIRDDPRFAEILKKIGLR